MALLCGHPRLRSTASQRSCRISINHCQQHIWAVKTGGQQRIQLVTYQWVYNPMIPIKKNKTQPLVLQCYPIFHQYPPATATPEPEALLAENPQASWHRIAPPRASPRRLVMIVVMVMVMVRGPGMVLVMVSQNHLQLVKCVGNSHLGEHDVHRACD